MSFHRSAPTASTASTAPPAAPLSQLLPCRSCYTPTVASQLRPYRYLSILSFSSDFAHSHCVCPECDYWLHPDDNRSDLWELVDGKDVFCRLCGDGDRSITAVVCDEDSCTFAFCVLCVRANGGERMLREVSRDGRWVCFNHKERPSGCEATLLDAVDLVCRAERGQFSHRNVYDCFNGLTHTPIPSFTYLTPKAKQRWQRPPQSSAQPSLSSRVAAAPPKRLLSTCLYKWTSSAPKHHIKYLYGLMENMQHFLVRWPGWTLRLYYDNSLILPAAAPEDELDHVHSQSDELPADAADNSQYTQSLADAFRVLLSTFATHPSVELVWFNFPYLQDSSHHHHGHLGMAVRFLALADLGVSASHVVVVDLDNLWFETGRMQAEQFEAGKRYHRYHDIDYVFPLAGGSFNARVDRIQPDQPDASPFADIESHLHAFFTAHHRAPEVLRDKYGDRVDESESIAPAAATVQRAGKRGRTDVTQPSDGTEQRRKNQRVARRNANCDVSAEQSDSDCERNRRTNRSEQTLLDLPAARSVETEDEQQMEKNEEQKDGGSELTNGRRSSRRISAAAERRRMAEERAKRAEEERVREQRKQQRMQKSSSASSSSPLTPRSSSNGSSDNERRDLHHYFFGYSCDQVFLQERVWPVVKQSCATTIVQLEHIKPDKRDRNRQEEAAVAEWDRDRRLSRCDEVEHERRQLIRSRARERSRWQAQRQKRLFKHYLGMVDERHFPLHHNIRDWLSRRVREVWSLWRHHSTGTTAAMASGGSRRSSTWQPRVDPPLTLDIHSLVTAPGHFSALNATALALYRDQLAPPPAAAYIGPPSTTSPIDFNDRWTAQQETHKRRTEPLRSTQQRQQLSSHSRQLSFSRADAPVPLPPHSHRLPVLPPRPPLPPPPSAARCVVGDVIDVSGADSSEDECEVLCSMVAVYTY